MCSDEPWGLMRVGEAVVDQAAERGGRWRQQHRSARHDRNARCEAEARAAALLAECLKSTDPISRADLDTAIKVAFGGTDADGCWTQRDSFDIREFRACASSARRHQTAACAPRRAAGELLDLLPTQTWARHRRHRASSSTKCRQGGFPRAKREVVRPSPITIKQSIVNGLPRIELAPLNACPGCERLLHQGNPVSNSRLCLDRKCRIPVLAA